jgi:hypothetical protein
MCSACDLRGIIRATLKQLGDWSPAAENLLLGTALQESGGTARLREGRRLGVFRISAATHRAVWDNYLVNHPELASEVRGLAGQHGFLRDPHGELVTNLKYAIAIAWMIYRRHGQALPDAEDIAGLARHWQRHFHCRARGNISDFIDGYRAAASPAHAA